MAMKRIKISELNFVYCKHKDFNFNPVLIDNVKNMPTERVALPHDIALSVTGFKTPEELYKGVNVLKVQEYEDVDAFYYIRFNAEEGEYVLKLNRVDVFADVYLNGEKVLSTDNAFIAFEQRVKLKTENKLIIHIKPALLEALKYNAPCGTFTLRYNGASLYLRKPAHAWGWDIMPRIPLGGIFDDIIFEPFKCDRIRETYLYTQNINSVDKTAMIEYAATFDIDKTDMENYEVETVGECGDSKFENRDRLWSNHFRFIWWLDNVKLWDVKNFGKPNLYTLTTKLYYKGVLVDEKVEKIGIRKIELIRTDCCDEKSGEFVFKINGRETFIMGTNWVPADALYSNADNRRRKLVGYMDDLGFNMVRVWGGGIYEPDEFYEFCDEHGILVWQDFMMACGTYPQDEWFKEKFREEAEQVVKRLRNHPSIAIWAGDNECDYFTVAHNSGINLEMNGLTREIIPQVLYSNDPARPYLPSSPYISPEVRKTKKRPSENHCWGPRDFFKSEYYKTCENAVFISEIGYMGLPSVKSLKKFIREENLMNFDSDEYIVHLSNMTLENPYYKFRINQDLKPIEYLFGEMPDNIEDIVRCSQIASAEGFKYFIERMRIRKDRKRGIMLWNMADGWPQLSEAFVDYYYDKKISYEYVKRSQQPLCLMMDETEKGVLLAAVNDTDKAENLCYKVTDALTGNVLFDGKCGVDANGLTNILYDDRKGRTFYKIEWTTESGKNGSNHFVSFLQGVSLSDYKKAMRKFEIKIGFGEGN